MDDAITLLLKEISANEENKQKGVAVHDAFLHNGSSSC